MYDRLARGHATAFVNNLPDHADVMAWFEGPQAHRVLDVFEKSSRSKKPGRTLKRLTPLLKPAFTRPLISEWGRQSRRVIAATTTVARENRVFRLAEDAMPLYCERSVFRIDLILTGTPMKAAMGCLIASNITHHALARLVERECTTPGKLPRHAEAALITLRTIALNLPRTDLDPDQRWAFLIPHEDGALVAVTMDVEPYRFSEQAERSRIVSVRTFLENDMLWDADHDRMEGLEAALCDYLALNRDPLHHWMERNARPWSFSAATVAEAEMRAPNYR